MNISDWVSQFSTAHVLEHPHYPLAHIDVSQLVEGLWELKKNSAYRMDFLKYLTIVEWEEDLEALYHLQSYPRRHEVCISTRLPKENPTLPSVHQIWPAANWHEREMYDLFGVHFTDHPNLKRLLLPPDWIGHPLRKDFQEQETFQGVSTTRTYLTQLPSAPTEESS